MSRPSTPRRANLCEEKLEKGWCRCHPAEYSSLCQSCHKRVNKGDCITHNISGWIHVECPIGIASERGIRSIEAGFNNNVDYGGSFLRIAADGEQRSMPTPQRLLSYFDDQEDTKMPAASVSSSTADDSSKKRPIDITQDDEADDDGVESNKRSKYDNNDSMVAVSKNWGSYSDDKRTDEQMNILNHEPKLGDVVTINALAGCGKTSVSECFVSFDMSNIPLSNDSYIQSDHCSLMQQNLDRESKQDMPLFGIQSYCRRRSHAVQQISKKQYGDKDFSFLCSTQIFWYLEYEEGKPNRRL